MLRASSQAICVPRPRLKPVQTFLGFGFFRFLVAITTSFFFDTFLYIILIQFCINQQMWSVTKKSCGRQRKDLATKYRIPQCVCCFFVSLIAMVNSCIVQTAHQIYSGRFWGTRFPTAKSSGGCPLIFPGFCKRSQISNLHWTMLDSPPIRGLLQQYDGVFGFFRPTI